MEDPAVRLVDRARACLVCLCAITVVLAACSDDPGPTDVVEDVGGAAPARPPQESSGRSLYSERAHPFPEAAFDLRSSPADLAVGLFRYTAAGTDSLPDVSRDDFIIAATPEGPTVRRVLSSRTVDGELVIDTGPAYWHEVIQGGTYSVRMPLDGSSDALFEFPGPLGASISVAGDGLPLPPVEHIFTPTDLCAWALDIVGNAFCGEPKEAFDFSVAGVSLSLTGTLDSLTIRSGRMRVTGDADVAMTVDAGSISGGRAPVFAPCDRGAYLGCIATPTGADFVEFLRRYVPSIPEASLPSIRVCIPGTPVRVARGYWSGLTYHFPVYEQCRVTDTGQLPTVVLPSVQAVNNEIRPHLVGDITMRLVGDGTLGLKLPIPGVAAQKTFQVTNDFKAKAAIGLFVDTRATLRNMGVTIMLTFDDTGRLTQVLSDANGWESDFVLTDKSNLVQLLEITEPDTVVVRAGGLLEAKVEVCIALYGCVERKDTTEAGHAGIIEEKLFGQLNLGAELGAGISFFAEGTWSRDQIDPNDDQVDNWHVALEGAYDLSVKAGVTIPLTGWILPSWPRKYQNTWECCRVPMEEFWGQGRLQVTTTTTGVDVDADGYSVLVQRADSLPSVARDGTNVVYEFPLGVHETAIDVDGSALFGYPVFEPCAVLYSDVFLFSAPGLGIIAAGARSKGANIPTYAAVGPCEWLIARYEVTLSDVAANCTVDGGAVRDSVWLQQKSVGTYPRGDTATVHFDVTCDAAGAQGGLQVVLTPNGRGAGPPPYMLLDGVSAGSFSQSDTVTLSALTPGSYQVELMGLAEDCSAAPESVDVSDGSVTTITPLITCVPSPPQPGSVTYAATLTGTGTDETGYEIAMNGVRSAFLPVDGSGVVNGIGPSAPTVFMVTNIAGNCQPSALNPRLITLDGAQTPVQVAFPVECFASKPDTLEGTLDASSFPTTTVTLRTADGTTLVVSGPLVGELAKLTGTPVRVWGRTSATGVSVHGYDLRYSLGDDRWLGIVLDRADGTWLFGEEAIKLVDAPAGLVAASGSLVWIMGSEVVGGVRPTIYGIVRGG